MDSLRVLKEINKQAKKTIALLIVFFKYIATEESKYGLSVQESQQAIKIARELPHLRIKGLMGMASFTEDQQIEREFAGLKSLYDKYKNKNPLKLLSMGMSGDFLIAIEQGSNMIRVGSKIFGQKLLRMYAILDIETTGGKQ